MIDDTHLEVPFNVRLLVLAFDSVLLIVFLVNSVAAGDCRFRFILEHVDLCVVRNPHL